MNGRSNTGPIGIVLGSGLGPLAAEVEPREQIPFSEAGLPPSSVPGHEGCMIEGLWNGTEVIVMKGRLHLYEGFDARTVTAGIRWLADRGARGVILTNAAGSLRPELAPGGWMMIDDHINFTGTSPLSGAVFTGMSDAYDTEWRNLFRRSAAALDCPLHEGIYAGLRGPQYETPAEVRMLRALGADAVGMSTVLETIQARALGMKVAAFSCLTNLAAGLSADEPHHDEVLATGIESAAPMIRLLRETVRILP
jgi:purine-nucleoside phosphorylase